MSDAEYRRLLRQLGAPVSEDMSDAEIEDAANVLRFLGYL